MNASEALLMLRNCDSLGRVALPGSQGHAVETRQTAVKDIAWPCGHRCPRSTEDTQPQPFLMRVEHGNPARVRCAFGWAGKPTVRGANSLVGKDAQEAKAGGRKATGKRGGWPNPPQVASYNWPDTGPGARTRKRADMWQVSL